MNLKFTSRTHLFNLCTAVSVFIVLCTYSCTTEKFTDEDYFELGKSEWQNRSYLNAISNFDKAIKLNPECIEAYFERADSYFYLKDYNAAISDYYTALSKLPKGHINRSYAHFNLGVLYEEMNCKINAMESYKNCLSVNPDFYGKYFDIAQRKLESIRAELNEKLEKNSITLRRTPSALSPHDVQDMIIKFDFYSKECLGEIWANENTSGFSNEFYKYHKDSIIVDISSGLMWQNFGSQVIVDSNNVKNYIIHINKKKYAGYCDWRLPSLEEAMSLIESQNVESLFIDKFFDRTQRAIWTCDKLKYYNWPWYVNFVNGNCIYLDPQYTPHIISVRAVRQISEFS